MSASAASQGGQSNISEWVTRIQQQHSGAAGATSTSAQSPVADIGNSADALEDEVKKAREERMRRRGHIVSGTDNRTMKPKDSVTSPTLSGDETLKKLLAERGSATPTPSLESADRKEEDNVQSMKRNALLDRYGGAAGPTGVARPGTHDSPVSLASFMGGKASGPRLGKLAGDGRSAPPEADLIHASRNALPGLARQSQPISESSGGTPLANFLEARASGRASPTRLGFSPPKRSYSPPKLQDKPMNIQTVIQTDRLSGYQPARKDAATSPFKSPDFKPSVVQNVSASYSSSTSTNTALSPGSIVHSPTADALSRFPEVNPVPSAKSPLPSPKVQQEDQGLSPAFLATQQSSEKLPTASLTRLRSQKMVEQRVREAQERGNSQEQALPPPNRSPQIVGGNSVRELWKSGDNESVQASAPQRSPFTPPSSLSNALPGLSGRSGATAKNLYAVNRKTPEEEATAFAAPVRLPGMGGSVSPFASRKNTEEADNAVVTLEPLAKGRVKPKRTVASSTSANTLRNNPDIEPGSSQISASAAQNASEEAPRLSLTTSSDPHMHPRTHADRQQSSSSGIDSATMIQDNTAALEALLEGRTVHSPPVQISAVPAENLKHRAGTLKIAKNKDRPIQLDHSILTDTSKARKEAALLQSRKTVSFELHLIHQDGTTSVLQGDDDAAATLYETETQVIVHRFKESATSGIVSTKVYARVGRLSSIVLGQNSVEARKAMDIAQSHRVPLIDARQGRESIELAQLLGGCLITREGSRQDGAKEGAKSMFQIREMQRTLFIDQVDVLTASLSSAFTVLLIPVDGSAIVWHGKGASRVMRQAGVQFAESLTGSSATITQLEEGKESRAFWTLLDHGAQYSDAWHHQLLPMLSQDTQHVRMFGIQDVPKSGTKMLIEIAPFSALDVRRDGVYLLQLPLELYVLIGPDARSQRQTIEAMLEASVHLSRHLAKMRGPHIMTAPTHVLVFPSLVPREVRSAFRYWHDEHLNGKRWQRMQLRMNVWERKEALQQMQRNEYSLAELDDDLFLPVGVGLNDVRELDI